MVMIVQHFLQNIEKYIMYRLYVSINILILSIFFSDSGCKMYLHELLTGSEVYVEPLKLPEKVGANLFDVSICFISKASLG